MIDQRFIASPAELGFDPKELQRLDAFIEGEIAAGLPSAQLSLGRHGRVIAPRANHFSGRRNSRLQTQ